MKKNAFKSRWQGIGGIRPFLARYGAICAAVLCVALVGGTYLLTDRTIPSPSLTSSPTPSAAAAVTPEPSTEPVMGDNLTEPETTPTTAPDSSETFQLFPNQIPELTRPVAGEIITPYAMDSLLYNETLCQWETHCGVDLAATADEAVKSVMSGTVTSVTEDTLMGKMVVVTHDNEWVSVYAALADVSVSTGQEIAAGDTLGTAGNTAGKECSLDNHLHFELMHKGVYQDPTESLQ